MHITVNALEEWTKLVSDWTIACCCCFFFQFFFFSSLVKFAAACVVLRESGWHKIKLKCATFCRTVLCKYELFLKILSTCRSERYAWQNVFKYLKTMGQHIDSVRLARAQLNAAYASCQWAPFFACAVIDHIHVLHTEFQQTPVIQWITRFFFFQSNFLFHFWVRIGTFEIGNQFFN